MCLILLWKIIKGLGELCDQRKQKLAIIFDVPKKWDVWGSGCIIPCIHNSFYYMEVSGQFYAQFSSPVGKTLPVPNWLGCISSHVAIMKKYFSCGKWSTNCSACSLVTACTELHSLLFESAMSQNNECHNLLKIQEKVADSFISLT